MKLFVKILKYLCLLIAIVIAGLYISGYGYIVTAVRTIYFHGHKTAFLSDYKYFPNRLVDKGKPQPWALAKDYNKYEATQRLEQTNKELKTVAYLIFKNDSLWYEKYYDDYGIDSKSNSFSMAKSITSAALGKAIQEGKIESLEQSVIDFLPNLKGEYKAEVSVGDLSSMSSGLKFDENYYSAFSLTTQIYFDKRLRHIMINLPITEKPGQVFEYKSGNTQLLAMVLEKATGTSLSEYVSEKFWKPMGAEHEALWQIDQKDNGIEKAYCCFASNARDFARFGKLYKDYGKWNGEQILDSAFVAKSTTPRFDKSPEYGYGFWLAHYRDRDFFYMRGHLGQFVIVSPKDNIIIVRLGHIKGFQSKEDPHSEDLYVYIDEAYKMLEHRN